MTPTGTTLGAAMLLLLQLSLALLLHALTSSHTTASAAPNSLHTPNTVFSHASGTPNDEPNTVKSPLQLLTSDLQDDTAVYATYDEFVAREIHRDVCKTLPCVSGGGALAPHLFSTADFGLGNEGIDSAPTEYGVMTETQARCRLKGYLQFCNNPYRVSTGTDVLRPALVDFAVLRMGLQPQDYIDAPDVKQFPLFVSGGTPIFNLGPAVPRLRLSMSVLARIFRGCEYGGANDTSGCQPNSILYWNHTDIATLNPDYATQIAAFGPIIKIVHSEASAPNLNLKKFMAATDPAFAAQIPVDRTGNYRAVINLVKVQGSVATAAAIAATPGSISYQSFQDAMNLGSPTVDIVAESSTTRITRVSVDSIGLAADIVGVAFGNDGSDPDRHVIEVGPQAAAINAWPMAFYVYMAVRTNTVRPGGTCRDRKYLLDLYRYMTNDPVGRSLMAVRNYVPLPDAVAKASLTEFYDHVQCNDTQVYENTNPVDQVQVYTAQALWPLMQTMAATTGLSDVADVALKVPSTRTYHERLFTTEWLPSASLLLADENTSADLAARSTLHVANIPVAVIGMAFWYNFCLSTDETTVCPYADTQIQLDRTTAALILDGEITNWNDTRIVSQQAPGTLIPNVPITIASSPFLVAQKWARTKLQACCKADFEFSAPVAPQYQAPSVASMFTMMSATVGSFAFAVMNQSIADAGMHAVALLNQAGAYVLPGYDSLVACTNDTYFAAQDRFVVDSSTNPACYPLAMTLSLVFRTEYANESFVDPNALDKHNISLASLPSSQSSSSALAATSSILDSSKIGCRVAYKVTQFLNATLATDALKYFEIGGFGVAGLDTVVAADTGEVINLVERAQAVLDTVTCEGIKLLVTYQDLSLVGDGLTYAMYALAALVQFVCVVLALWTVRHRHRKLVRNSSPAFMLQVLFGAAVQASTVYALGQQDAWLAPKAVPPTDQDYFGPNAYLDNACRTQPVLFSLGFFIMFSALFLKSWRLIRIFNNRKLRHLYVTDVQLLTYQVGVIAVVALLNLVWGLTDPLVWRRSPTNFDDRNGLVSASVGLCFSRGGLVSALPLFLGIILFIVLGNWLAYQGRHIPTEFNESKWTAMAMVVNLQAFALGVPVLALANEQSSAGFAIKSLISIGTAASTVGLVFVPKLLLAYEYYRRQGESDVWQYVGRSSSSQDSKRKAVGGADAGHGGGGGARGGGSRDGVAVAQSGTGLHVAVSTTGGHHPTLSPSGSKAFMVGSGNDRGASKSHGGGNTPSLNSLIDTSFTFNANGTTRPVSKVSTKNFSSAVNVSMDYASASPSGAGTNGGGGGNATSEALASVLDEETLRRRFRRFLAQQKADENVRFLDAVEAFTKDPEKKRATSARAIISYFIVDTAPKQVNLKAETRAKLVALFKADDRFALADVGVFEDAVKEIIHDIKQSDGFKSFLEQQARMGGPGTSQNVTTSPSDASLS